VSSTVAEIVGNLRNVETPWKSQLTSLESQDTTISSLGTLFSNLSNDISGLTDFQGVIAQKQGSSSDTNVLTLRMDVGGRPAQALSEFYASIFAQILQASQSASRPKFEHTIDCVRNVRDAWREVARDPSVNPAPLQVSSTAHGARSGNFDSYDADAGVGAGSHWNA
jgi:hypothetical protein